jgi:hypothetical protein
MLIIPVTQEVEAGESWSNAGPTKLAEDLI